jgi:hypothetical protein
MNVCVTEEDHARTRWLSTMLERRIAKLLGLSEEAMRANTSQSCIDDG